MEKNEIFSSVITENYVTCSLYPKSKELYYYNFDRYEIDFLIKIDGDIIPTEVKSSKKN